MRRFISVCTILFAFVCAFFALSGNNQEQAVPVSADFPIIRRRVLLVPLDSRPPCGRFVQDAARIAGIRQSHR